MKIPAQDPQIHDMDHAIEKVTRWGAYVALAGVGALVLHAGLALAIIPIGVVMMIAGVVASGARRAR